MAEKRMINPLNDKLQDILNTEIPAFDNPGAVYSSSKTDNIPSSDPALLSGMVQDSNLPSSGVKRSQILSPAPQVTSDNVLNLEELLQNSIQYPEYEVVTPQTKYTFSIRSLTVSEEESLKTSITSITTLVKHINNLLWRCVVRKPDHIQNSNQFFSNVTLKDRDALLYAIYFTSYSDIHEYNIQCKQCKHKYIVKANVSSFMDTHYYEGNPGEIIKKRITVDLKNFKGSVVLKQPVIMDEISYFTLIGNDEDALNYMTLVLLVDSFELKQGNRPVVVNNLLDISRVCHKLSASDRKIIEITYLDNFGKAAVEFGTQSICPRCNTENREALDLISEFFRAYAGGLKRVGSG